MPTTDREDVLRLLDETDAAKARLGGMLNTRELLDIASLLTASRRVAEYDAERQGEPTVIDHLFSALHSNRHLENRIRGAILDEETIADTASSELADIRRKIRIAASKGRQISPITSWQIDGGTTETVTDFTFWAPKSLQMVTAAMKLKDACWQLSSR